MTFQPVLCAEPELLGAVFDGQGELVDYCTTWQAGQVYANAGYYVQALNPDTGRFGRIVMEVEEAQDLYDYERRIAADCFGPGVREDY